jgi:hypothetical protein
MIYTSNISFLSVIICFTLWLFPTTDQKRILEVDVSLICHNEKSKSDGSGVGKLGENAG